MCGQSGKWSRSWPLILRTGRAEVNGQAGIVRVQFCACRLQADQRSRQDDVPAMRADVYEELVTRLPQVDVSLGREGQRNRQPKAAAWHPHQLLRLAFEIDPRRVIIAVQRSRHL